MRVCLGMIVFRIQPFFGCQYFDESLAFKVSKMCQIINKPIEIGKNVKNHDNRLLVLGRLLVSFCLCFTSTGLPASITGGPSLLRSRY